jgi:hypothetical protein
MNDREFSVVCSALDDCRRLIAAGKVQRWDVVKWGTAVNLGLATVSAAQFGPPVVLLIIAGIVSIGSLILLLHYNKRMTEARKTATGLVRTLDNAGLKYETLVTGSPAYDYTKQRYDKEELIVFIIFLVAAPFLVLLRSAVPVIFQ